MYVLYDVKLVSGIFLVVCVYTHDKITSWQSFGNSTPSSLDEVRSKNNLDYA